MAGTRLRALQPPEPGHPPGRQDASLSCSGNPDALESAQVGSRAGSPPCFLLPLPGSGCYSEAAPPSQPCPPAPGRGSRLLIRIYQPGLIPSPESLAKFCLALCPFPLLEAGASWGPFADVFTGWALGPSPPKAAKPARSPLDVHLRLSSRPVRTRGFYVLGQRARSTDSQPLSGLFLVRVISPPQAICNMES